MDRQKKQLAPPELIQRHLFQIDTMSTLSSWVVWIVVVISVLGFAVDGACPKGVKAAAVGVTNPAILDSLVQTLHSAKKHLLSAAVARSISIFGMFPVDTIKTRIQIEQPNPFRLTGLYRT